MKASSDLINKLRRVNKKIDKDVLGEEDSNIYLNIYREEIRNKNLEIRISIIISFT